MGSNTILTRKLVILNLANLTFFWLKLSKASGYIDIQPSFLTIFS